MQFLKAVGKQFKAVEGNYIEVDHLPVDVGKKIIL
jgi:ribosomal protein L21